MADPMLRKRFFTSASVPVLIVALLAMVVSFSSAKPRSGGTAVVKDQLKVDPNAAPVPPADAQWTLYCQAVAGPGHVEQANAAKEQLIVLSKMKDWYIIHQEGENVIYYGFYKSIDEKEDRNEAARAKAERSRIDALTNKSGDKIFQHCFFVQVSEPDPTAPAEWNLLNTGAYWSLQIAAYKDSPRRKQAAVEAVREARARGVNAFYYHGETTSSVCIGAWPRDAVKAQDEGDVAQANDPSQDLLVLPQPLPKGQDVEIRNRQGDRVKAVAPRFEPVDPSLIATIAQYPTHPINGVVYVSRTKDAVNGEVKAVEDPSFLVQVPKPQQSLLRASQEPPSLIAPVNGSQATPGAGQLKSIGGK